MPLLPLLLLTAPASAERLETLAALVCTRAEGCPEEQHILAAWADRLGAAVVPLEALTAAALAGGDDLARLRDAPPEQALALLPELPLTLSPDALFELTLTLGEARLAVGDAGAGAAFAMAASSSDARMADLPRLSAAALSAYADAAEAASGSATLTLTADAPQARLFIDGALAGEAPLEVPLREGWHRISVEWPDRRRAWTAEVTAADGERLRLAATRPSEDHPGAVAAAAAASLRGAPLPPELSAALTDWAGARGARLLLVEVQAASDANNTGDDLSGERFEDERGGAWSLSTLSLDGGGWTVASPRSPTALAWGFAAGPVLLGGGGAASVDGELRLVRERVDWTVRLGVLQLSEPLWLYETRSASALPTVALGPLVGRERGPYGGLMALAIAPYALGGQGVLGWGFTPAPGRRLALEARAGATDKGWLTGASLYAGAAR